MKKKGRSIQLFCKMTLKKEFPDKLKFSANCLNSNIRNIIYGIEDDYPEIKVYKVTSVLQISDTIDICLDIDLDFAKKNMYFDGKFDPERYLGFYFSRVARRLRKKFPALTKYYWEPGMFAYEFFY